MIKKVRGNNNQATWSGVVLVIIVVMLIGIYFLRIGGDYIIVEDKIDPNLVVYKTKVANAAVEEEMQEYSNNSHDFKIKYPEGWQEEEESIGEGTSNIFTVTFSSDEDSASVSVMDKSMEGIVRNTININNENPVQISNVEGARIEGGSSKDGSPVTNVLLINNDKLYVLQGSGQTFDDIVSNFELI